MREKIIITEELFRQLEENQAALLSDDGREILDPRPMTVPTGLGRPETLKDQIRRVLRQELSDQASRQGFESEEEANDFDVGDEFERGESLNTKYTVMEDEFPIRQNEPPTPPEAPTEPAEEDQPSPDQPAGSTTPDDPGPA